jgi:hypothetical protein
LPTRRGFNAWALPLLDKFFQHTFPHEPSSLSHWRKRLGDKLGQELARGPKTGALPAKV